MIFASWGTLGEGIMRSILLQNPCPFTLTASSIFHFSPWKAGNEFSVNRNISKSFFSCFLPTKMFFLISSMAICIDAEYGQDAAVLPSPLSSTPVCFSLSSQDQREKMSDANFEKQLYWSSIRTSELSELHNRPPSPHPHRSSYFRLIFIFGCFYYF